MIKDLQLLRDISPLFEKKIVVWGIGQNGRAVINDINAMGGGKKGIFLCDSDPKCQKQIIEGNKILSPEELKKSIDKNHLKEVIFLVTAASLEMQDEILENIEELFGNIPDIYTIYAIRLGIYFNIQNPYVEKSFQNRVLMEHQNSRQIYNETLWPKMNALKYFAFLPLYNNPPILIYQPGKVASSSIFKSIQNYDQNALQVHTLEGLGDNNDLYKLLNMRSGKIISLVRDPVMQRMSAMWHNLSSVDRYPTDVNFSDIERKYFAEGFENEIFEWFYREIYNFFKIDIFKNSFDQEKGYCIIKQENIELLLIKVEKLNELEDVIGEFLNICHFKLQNDNVGKKKPYRHAFQAYMKEFAISQNRLNEIYRRNTYIKHFYSESECNEFYRKWLKDEER